MLLIADYFDADYLDGYFHLHIMGVICFMHTVRADTFSEPFLQRTTAQLKLKYTHQQQTFEHLQHKKTFQLFLKMLQYISNYL